MPVRERRDDRLPIDRDRVGATPQRMRRHERGIQGALRQASRDFVVIQLVKRKDDIRMSGHARPPAKTAAACRRAASGRPVERGRSLPRPLLLPACSTLSRLREFA